MKRIDWLKKKHAELDARVTELEDQRTLERGFDHKATLIDLKKQRLAIREELECYLSSP